MVNKKGVESLPLKYIIIALVAALCIGIVVQFTDILRGGTIGAAERMNETLSRQMICELDEEPPEIRLIEATCYYETIELGDDEEELSANISVTLEVTDECGVESVYAYADGIAGSFSFEKSEGDIWVHESTENILPDEEIELRIFAEDKSFRENRASRYETINCEQAGD